MRRIASDRANFTLGSAVVVMGFSFPFGLLARHGTVVRTAAVEHHPRMVTGGVVRWARHRAEATDPRPGGQGAEHRADGETTRIAYIRSLRSQPTQAGARTS